MKIQKIKNKEGLKTEIKRGMRKENYWKWPWIDYRAFTFNFPNKQVAAIEEKWSMKGLKTGIRCGMRKENYLEITLNWLMNVSSIHV